MAASSKGPPSLEQLSSFNLTPEQVSMCREALTHDEKLGGEEFVAMLRQIEQTAISSPETRLSLLKEIEFRCLERLWEVDQKDDAAAARAVEAWWEALPLEEEDSVEWRVTPAFLAFILRLLCAYSRQPSPLAPDLTRRPALKLGIPAQALLIARTAAHLRAWRGRFSRPVARAFIAAGGLDAAVHLILYPPPHFIFVSGQEATVRYRWLQLFALLEGLITGFDKAAHKAIRRLYNVPGPSSYDFPYEYALAPCNGSIVRASNHISVSSLGQLLVDTAAALLCDGNPELVAWQAGLFLEVFLQYRTVGFADEEKCRTAVRAVLEGNFGYFLRRRLQELRSMPHSEHFASVLVMSTRQLLLLFACLARAGPGAVTHEVVDAALSVLRCYGHDHRNLTAVIYFFETAHLGSAEPEQFFMLDRRFRFPSCFNPAVCQEGKEMPRLLGSSCPTAAAAAAVTARAPAVSGLFLQLFIAGFAPVRAKSESSAALRTLVQYHAQRLVLPLQEKGRGFQPGHEHAHGLYPIDVRIVRAARSPSEASLQLGPDFFPACDAWSAGLGVSTSEVVGALRTALVQEGRLDGRAPAPDDSRCFYPECKAPSAPKLQACTRCRRARYCSAACQRAHWPAHKEACTAVAKASAGVGAGAGAGAKGKP